jgi:nitrite reductase (cytochrome c-552)
VARSKLEEDPRLKTMWAGYAFSVDYRERRGHAYMLIDQRSTGRVLNFKQPGTCLNCHASMVKAYREQGGGDINKGFEKINQMTYNDATKIAQHPVACIDCHQPESMKLRVTRPAFIEGIRAYKLSKASKTTMSTLRPPRRKCGRSSADNATSSITSRGPKSG